MDLKRTLERMVKENASDLHLKAGLPPVLRIDGFLRPLEEPPLSPEELRQVALQLMPKDQQQLFADEKELDFSMGVAGLGRFRVNVYMQRGSVALAMRAIPFNIKKVDELMLPPITKELALSNRGLLLVTGTTGSGKSTTLASMLEFINETENRNIITVEDPIEMVIEDFNQIGVQHTAGVSFANILPYILRQDPDIIMVGEIRDKETADHAIQSALTGHLVLTTLHTNDSPSAIIRLMDIGIPYYLIASTVVGIVAQRLVRKICPHCRAIREVGPDDPENKLLEEKVSKLYYGEGCSECRNTGYKGRTGIFEVMEMTENVKAALTRTVTINKLNRAIAADGMMDLKQVALRKMIEGVTTYEEVYSVSG